MPQLICSQRLYTGINRKLNGPLDYFCSILLFLCHGSHLILLICLCHLITTQRQPQRMCFPTSGWANRLATEKIEEKISGTMWLTGDMLATVLGYFLKVVTRLIQCMLESRLWDWQTGCCQFNVYFHVTHTLNYGPGALGSDKKIETVDINIGNDLLSRGKVRSLVIQEGLRRDAPLHVERGWLSWFRHLTRMPSGHLLGEVFVHVISGRGLRADPGHAGELSPSWLWSASVCGASVVGQMELPSFREKIWPPPCFLSVIQWEVLYRKTFIHLLAGYLNRYLWGSSEVLSLHFLYDGLSSFEWLCFQLAY